MKIYRPVSYHRIARITFSKKNVTNDRKAVSIVEFTKEQLQELIERVYMEELKAGDSNRLDFVNITVQVMTYPGSGLTKKTKKDEWSYRLYRCDTSVIDRLIAAADGLKEDPSTSRRNTVSPPSSNDPFSLKPFDKVLVKVGGRWVCDFYQWFNGDSCSFITMCNGEVKELIPFVGWDDYLGTDNDIPDKYKL